MKRFYKDVSVTPDLGIALDGRSVKTPAKATLTLLNTSMAEAVADEWRAQKTDIDPHSMPFTGFANAATTSNQIQFGGGAPLVQRNAGPPRQFQFGAARKF